MTPERTLLAAQKCRICVPPRAQRRPTAGVHIGGSACVTHSLCCPVGGRPASPRKSHSKSQRGQTSGDTQLRQATVEAGQVPNEPHRATPSDAREVTGGQGVAGSNPAVPTGSGVFFEIICASREPAKEPSSCEMAPSKARRSGGTASYQGMCQYGRAADGGSQGVKD